MPKMSGISAFKELKKIAPDLPVILMTAYSVQGLIGEAQGEGLLEIIEKPVETKRIVGIVEEMRGRSSVLIVDRQPDPALLEIWLKMEYVLLLLIHCSAPHFKSHSR